MKKVSSFNKMRLLYPKTLFIFSLIVSALQISYGQQNCPTFGDLTVETSSFGCSDDPFDVTVEGLTAMDLATNGEADFGVEIVYFANTPADPYIGGTSLGVVTFSELTNGGTAAELTNLQIPFGGTYEIFALLSPQASDPTCTPNAMGSLTLGGLPEVLISLPSGLDTICTSEDPILISNAGTPSGGFYSGPGVTDNFDGTNSFEFDPSEADVPVSTITYTVIDDSECSGIANVSVDVDILVGPDVSLELAVDSVCANDAPIADLGGGLPSGGVYSGPGVTDDGNGMTFSFDPAAADPGINEVTYTVALANGCISFDVDTIDVEGEEFEIVPLDDQCVDGFNQTGFVIGRDTLLFAGTLEESDPTYFRVTATSTASNCNVASGSAFDVNFDSYSFSVASDQDGILVANSFPDGHFLALYENSFDPDNACANLVAVNQAGSSSSKAAIIDHSFIADTTYILVVSVNDEFGNFQLGDYEVLAVFNENSIMGSFSGPGVTDDGNNLSYNFNPRTAGVGVHTISYDYTGPNGCSFTTTDTVEVFDLPEVSFTLDDNMLCRNEGEVTLGGGLPIGGVYSSNDDRLSDDGNGTTFTFNTSGPLGESDSNTPTIFYEITSVDGCTNDAVNSLIINSPDVSLTIDTTLCINDLPATGLTGGTPTGGVYSGTGVTDEGNGMTFTFNPAAGENEVIYTFTDSLGCTDLATDFILVAAPDTTIQFSAPDDLCIDAFSQTRSLDSLETITFVGTLEDTDPRYARVSCSCNGSSCSQITFSNTFNVFYDTHTFSVDEDVVGVISTVSFPGRHFFALFEGSFDPENACATFIVSDQAFGGISDNGRIDMEHLFVANTTYVLVISNPISTSPEDRGDYEAKVSFANNDITGTFNGPGVTDAGNNAFYDFDPAAAGLGIHTITYDYEDQNGCTNSVSEEVEVFDLPAVTFELSDSVFCEDAQVIDDLGGGVPTGGVYSGFGVFDDGNGLTFSFDADMFFGADNRSSAIAQFLAQVTYTFTDANGCSNSASDFIILNELPDVSLAIDTTVCINDLPATGLTGGTPTGGVYSGTGVTDEGNGMTFSFDPALAGAGESEITYTFTDSLGCSSLATDNITVIEADTTGLEFLVPTDACLNDTVQMIGTTEGLVLPLGSTLLARSVNTFPDILQFNAALDASGAITTQGLEGMDEIMFNPTTQELFIGHFINEGNTIIGKVDVTTGFVTENVQTPSIFFNMTFDNNNNLYGERNEQVFIIDLMDGDTTLFADMTAEDVRDITFNLDDNSIYTIGESSPQPILEKIDLATNNQSVIPLQNSPVTSFSSFVYIGEDTFLAQGDDEIYYIIDLAGEITEVPNIQNESGFFGLEIMSGPVCTYSGPGVTDNGDGTYTFDPAAAGVGVHTITCEFTDGSCSSTITEEVEVLPLPEVTFTLSQDSICFSDGLATGLGGGLPLGGVYSGEAVVDDGNGMTFSINALEAEMVDITYSFTDDNGCTNSAIDLMNVTVPEVSFPDQGICLIPPQTIYTLSGGMPTGGVYSGSFVEDQGNGITFTIGLDNGMPIGTPISVEYTFTDETGCSNTVLSSVSVNFCELEISDPCTCLDNATIFDIDTTTGGDDGQFSEIVTVTDPNGGDLPAGQIWTVTAASGAFDAFDVPAVGTQSAGVPLATDGSVTLLFNAGVYEVPFVHVDDLGYTMTVEGPFAVGDPNNVSLDIANKCAYPNPVFSPSIPSTIFSSESIIFLDVTDANGDSGNSSITIDGVSTSIIDPSTLAVGPHVAVGTFSKASNGDISPDGGVTAAEPGCTQSITQEFEVVDCMLEVDCSNITNQTLACRIDIPPVDFDLLIVTDSCGSLTLSANTIIPGNTGCPGDTVFVERSYFIEDSLGNSDVCSQTFTIISEVGPSFTFFPADTMVLCGANTDPNSVGIAEGTEQCPGDFGGNNPTITFSDTTIPGSCIGEEMITRTWTVTDKCGRSVDSIQTIMVVDTIAPTMLCQSVELFLDESGMVTLDVSLVDNGSMDNCGGTIALSLSQETFGCENVGTNQVTLIGEDECGNIDSCTAIVTVLDTIPPMVSCVDTEIFLDENGMASVTGEQLVGMITVTTIGGNNNSDAEGQTFYTVMMSEAITLDIDWLYNTAAGDLPSFDPFGYHLNGDFILLVDTLGTQNQMGSQSGSFTITLNPGDIFGPQVNTKDNRFGSASGSFMGIPVTGQFSEPNWSLTNINANGNALFIGLTDNCGIDSLQIDMMDFTCADVGDNTVTVTVTDVNGNKASCESIVTVSDTIPPAAVCQNLTAFLDADGMVTITAADVDGGSTDNCGLMSIDTDATTFDCSQIGDTTITLTVIDVNGNVDSCTAMVSIVDTISPMAVCIDTTLYLDAMGAVAITSNELDGGSTDACGIMSVSIDTESFTCDNVGDNLVTLTVQDVNGNFDSCTATVTVLDTIAPTAMCMDTILYLDTDGLSSITAEEIDAGSTDVCGILNLTIDNENFTCDNIDENLVTLTVEDVNGNTSTCASTIIVLDTIAPVAICQNITAFLDDNGTAIITAQEVDGGSSDACGIMELALDTDEFSCDDIGENMVTLTVTDANGNSSTCISTITVEDALAPIAICQDVTLSLDENGTVSIQTDGVGNTFIIDGGSMDNCTAPEDLIFAVSQTTFNCEDLNAMQSESIPVTLTVTDAEGNSSQCTANVTLMDDMPPVIDCPNDITVFLETGECEEIVLFDVPFMDNCGAIDAEMSQAINETLINDALDCTSNTSNHLRYFENSLPVPLDITQVSFGIFNSGTAETVTVNVYSIGPNLPFLYENMVQLASAEQVVPTGMNNTILTTMIEATIPVGMNYVLELKANNTTNFVIGYNTSGEVGATFISGNDPVPCVSSEPTDIDEIGFPGFAVVLFSNAEGGVIIEQTTGLPSGSYFPIGTTTQTFVATDAFGNTAECTFDVVVNEFENGVTGVLACNDLINISLDQNCELILNADMLLEGDIYGCFDDYIIDVSGGIGSSIITEPGLYTVTITDPDTGNSCWSQINVESKAVPIIDCSSTLCPIDMLEGEWSSTDNTFSPGVAWAFDGGAPNDDILYDVIEFVVETPGLYTLTMTSSDDFDGIAGIYADSFDPSNPATNLIGGDDDIPGVFESEPDFIIELEAGTYALVSSTWGAGQMGVYTWSFAGPGDLLSDCEVKCFELDALLAGDLEIPNPEVTSCIDYDIYYSDAIDYNDCGLTTVTRTYVATNANGTSSCDVTFEIDPISVALDVDLPVQLVELNCNDSTDPADIAAIFDNPLTTDNPTTEIVENNEGYAFAYPTYMVNGHAQKIDNNVCEVYVAYTDLELAACAEGCAGNRKVIRTWTIVDWCTLEVSTFVQTIKAVDTEAPTLNTENIAVSTAAWGCAADFVVPTPWELHDNCDDSPRYTVTAPAGVIIEGNFEDGFTAIGAPKGVHTFNYVAYDCCGNEASYPFVVTVSDITPPVVISKQNIVVSLTSASTSPDGYAKLYAESVDNGSYDGCSDNVKLEIRRDTDNCDVKGNMTYNADNHPQDGSPNPLASNYDPDGGAYVKFCCIDLTTATVDVDGDGTNDAGYVKVWLRVWDDGDMDGTYGSDGDNYNESWSYVKVEDKLAPQITCPVDVTINCNDDYLDLTTTGEATGYGSCGGVPVEYKDVLVSLNTCNEGFVRRRWNIVGRTDIFCDQTITMEGIDAPVNVSFSAVGDKEFDCLDGISVGEPTWTAGPCDILGYTVATDTFRFEDGACYKLVNTYTVINWCDYDPNSGSTEGMWEHIQVIKIVDSTVPTIENCEDAMYAINDHADEDGDGEVCEAKLVLTNVAMDPGSDNCPTAWLKWTVEVDLWADGTPDYEYTSFIPGSSFNFNQFNTDANGNGIPDAYIKPTASGQEVSIPLVDIAGSMSNHKVNWTVTDGCNNTTSCSNEFMVVDKKSPTPYCIDINSAVMESNGTLELWAIDFNVGSFDNCTAENDLRYTFTDTSPENDNNYNPTQRSSSMTFDCDDVANSPIEVNMYVWDEKGNSDFCKVFLTLVDNTGACGEGSMIAGQIATESGDGVFEVETSLNSILPEYPRTEMTDASGVYTFGDSPLNADYDITASKDIDYLNGVSTLDLVKIQRHILGLESLDSPYKLIAADINADNEVKVNDLNELRKLILGVIVDLPTNESWRFVDGAQALDMDIDLADVNYEINIANFAGDMTNNDLVAVKVGDVTENATANLQTSNIEVRSNKTLDLMIDEQTIKAGNVVEVDFSSSNFIDVYGYQFTMELNGLEMADIAGGAILMTEHNIGVISNKVVTVSYHKGTAKTATATDELFTMAFTATQDGLLSEMIDITSKVTTAEAYISSPLSQDHTDGLDIKGITINTRNKTETALEFEIMQNEPNPFKDATTIGFRLPHDETVQFTVLDMTGRVILTRSIEGLAGYNEIQLKSEDLNGRGLLYYRIENDTQNVTKKMIVIE